MIVYLVHTGPLSFLCIWINKSHVIPHVTFLTLKKLSQKYTTYHSVAAQAIFLELTICNRKGVTSSSADETTPKLWLSVCSKSFECFCESGKIYIMYYTWITYHDEQITEQNYMYMNKNHLLSLLHICSVGVMAWVCSNGCLCDKL